MKGLDNVYDAGQQECSCQVLVQGEMMKDYNGCIHVN